MMGRTALSKKLNALLLQARARGGRTPSVGDEGVDDSAYAALVRRCGQARALAHGVRLHALMARTGRDHVPFLANLLMEMYGKCGRVEEARSVFEAWPCRPRGVVSWNILLSVYTHNGRPREALTLFERMRLECEPDKVSLLAALSACASSKSLMDGQAIHELVKEMVEKERNSKNENANKKEKETENEKEMEMDGALETALIDMYGKCGCEREARKVFDGMGSSSCHRDVVAWNAMIAAYVRNGCFKDALGMFWSMPSQGVGGTVGEGVGAVQEIGVNPDVTTFRTVLGACFSLESGCAIHDRILVSGFESNPSILTALLLMYSRCSPPPPLETIRSIHRHIIASSESMPPTLNSTFLLTILLNMYGRHSSTAEARTVFNTIPTCDCDAVAWTAMITAYAHNGEGRQAIELFKHMEENGQTPDKITFLSLLDASAGSESLPDGKLFHGRIAASGFESDTALKTALLNMYGKCRSLADAQRMFDRTDLTNVVAWNAIIAIYAQNGLGKEALNLFRQMSLSKGVKPDRSTFLSTLNACIVAESLDDGRLIHDLIVAGGFGSDIAVQNALINMYGKCGSLTDARAIFEKMEGRNIISWNSMTAAYTQNSHDFEALQLFRDMELEGVKPDKITFLNVLDACATLGSLDYGRVIHKNFDASGLEADVALETALLNMYGKCGSLKDARAIFDGMHQRDLISWNAMIAAYAQNGLGNEAMELYQQMEFEGVKPNRSTFVSIIDACASLGSLETGQLIHKHCVASGLDSDIAVKTALLNMYGKCGSPKDAWMVFDGIPLRDVIAWNAMIATYTQSGHVTEALELLRRMDSEGVKPDRITYLSILNSCATLASLQNGKAIHERIVVGGGGIDTDMAVNNALLNMYGKCGGLNNAQAVFDHMCERNAISWTTMIAAYAQSGQYGEALELFRQMGYEEGGAEPDKITFLSVLNACSHAGLLEEAWYYLVSIGQDSRMTPCSEHYLCIIDLFGRAGRFNEADNVMKNAPILPNAVAWTSLLGACEFTST